MEKIHALCNRRFVRGLDALFPKTQRIQTMKLRHSFIFGAALLSLGMCSASAQEGGNRIAEFLKRADTDGDGKVSKEEFATFSRKEVDDRFSKVDANGDGFADQDEISKIGDRVRSAAQQMRPGGEGGFRRPDGESGGFRRPPGEDAPSSDRPEGRRPEGGPPGERPEGMRRPEGGPPGGFGGMPNIDEIFGRMDKNADGSVNLEEYRAFSQQEIEQRFGRMDGNGDGNVSKEEMKSGMERLRSMMRGGPGGPGGEGGFRRPGMPGAPGGEGGFRRPPGEGGAPGGEGRGGFRRPPEEGGSGRPRPEAEAEGDKPAEKKDAI